VQVAVIRHINQYDTAGDANQQSLVIDEQQTLGITKLSEASGLDPLYNLVRPGIDHPHNIAIGQGQQVPVRREGCSAGSIAERQFLPVLG